MLLVADSKYARHGLRQYDYGIDQVFHRGIAPRRAMIPSMLNMAFNKLFLVE